MPVRSLHSSVMRWPDRDEVEQAVRAWAQALAAQEPGVVAVGYFGSYARGDWGVGSDVDLVVVVAGSALPPERRAVRWDLERLPVPAEALVYTVNEWKQLPQYNPHFAAVLAREAVWVWGTPP